MVLGFAIYRSGSPKNRREVAEMCALGIREIAVLAGNASRYERRWRQSDFRTMRSPT